MKDRTSDDSVLSRWSRRKLSGEDQKDETDAVDAEETLPESELDAQLTANREAAEAVDLESIDEESDLSIFMKPGVPDALKRKALAFLWRSNPVFANVDGLVDYDQDFANPDLIMKTFTSAYQVGRGYLKEIIEDEEMAETVSDSSELPDEAISEHDEAEESLELVEAVDETGDGHTIAQYEMQPDYDEPVLQEEESVPAKVSLRKRLDLEA